LTAVRDYYEELWERLPPDLKPPDLAPRLAFARAEITHHDRVLDLGCGQGDLTAELARISATILGVEVAQAAIERARSRQPELTFELAPIDGDLPLRDGAFDVVWASEVIEHVADTARWLSEVRRVLAPGGRLLLTTPNHGRLRLTLGGIERFSEPLGDHLHLYSAPSLSAVLSDFEFTDISVKTIAGPPLLRRLLTARAVR
jgi:SAM-dependent methyltransferase